MVQFIDAGVLRVAYETHGPSDGVPVVLLHGFPYDIHAYQDVAPELAQAGCRVILPWLRGFGPTRFLSPDTPRSGEQAALGHDLLCLLDALQLPSAVLAGYDWGGRAACVVSALWPQRVSGLVTGTGYNIQHIASALKAQPPDLEHKLWYQYYFHSERGRDGLARHRHDLCKLLWQQWSPGWAFDDDCYARSAAAFDNPDFVEVSIHSYRHRYGLVPGDPQVATIEARLAEQPLIMVPTITLHGQDDGVTPVAGSVGHGRFFSGPHERRLIPEVGHNIPQEAPKAFSRAILDLL